MYGYINSISGTC